jgi:hypothetical protein
MGLFIPQISVSQTVVIGGLQVVSEEETLPNIILDTKEMKNAIIYVCVETAFVG